MQLKITMVIMIIFYRVFSDFIIIVFVIDIILLLSLYGTATFKHKMSYF